MPCRYELNQIHAMRNVLIAVLLLLSIYTHAVDKIVISNTGQGWSNATNFNPVGVPQDGDVVYIPSVLSITVKGPVYGSTLPTLKIYIYGTLDFDPSGKLDLSSGSLVQLYAGGKITTKGSNSEQITMGGVLKYSGQNDGVVSGPKYTSGSTSGSIGSADDGGFVFGVLPIKLQSFNLTVRSSNVTLHWKVSQDSEKDEYTVQKLNNNKWVDLKLFTPSQSSSGATSYSFIDDKITEYKNYYRLKLSSINGSTFYSKILAANVSIASLGFQLHPNPAIKEAVLTWSKPLTNASIVVFNATGNKIFEQKINNAAKTATLDLQNFKKGIYFVTLTSTEGIHKEQFLKIN